MPEKNKPSSGNPLLDQISDVPQTGGNAFAPPIIPELNESKAALTRPAKPERKATPYSYAPNDIAATVIWRAAEDETADRERERKATQRLFEKQRAEAQEEAARLAPIEAQAMEDARAANPGLSDDMLGGWKTARMQYLQEELTKKEEKDIASFGDAHFMSLIGAGKSGIVDAMIGGRDKSILDNATQNLSDPEWRRRAASNPMNAIAPIVNQPQILSALLTAKDPFDRSQFIEDGKPNKDFKKQVYKIAGGDPKYFQKAAEAILQNKIDEYDEAPSAAAGMVNAAMEFTRKSHYAAGGVPGMGVIPKLGSRAVYYTETGAISGIKAAVKTGLFLGRMLKPGSSEQYRGAVEAVNQFQDKASDEGHATLHNLRHDPWAFFDGLASDASRLVGEVAATQPLAGRAGVVSAMFEKAAYSAGTKAFLANTTANKAFLGMAKTINAIDATRLPVYLDNVVTMTRMFGAPMYHDYYTDALAKGYSVAEAESKAMQRALFSTMAMSLANWAGPGAKDAMNKLPGEILNGVDRVAGKTFLGRTGKFGRSLLNQANVPGAALGGAGMATSAFGDAYQEHQERIELGEIDPGATFDVGAAMSAAAEAGMIGFLAMGLSHFASSHGQLTETPQATALYTAVADRTSFNAAVAKQVAKKAITPEQGQSLTAMVARIAPYVHKHKDAIRSGEMKPEVVVQGAIEEAKLSEYAEAIRDLEAQTSTVRIGAEGEGMDAITYGLDPATGIYTEAQGKILTDQINDLRDKAKKSQHALQQSSEGSYVQGRTVGGAEMLRLTAKFTPEGSLTTEQANKILSQGPYNHEEINIQGYMEDAQVRYYVSKLVDRRASSTAEERAGEGKNRAIEATESSLGAPLTRSEMRWRQRDSDFMIEYYGGVEEGNRVAGEIDINTKDGIESFRPQHANDPILDAAGNIIDGRKRIAWALAHGETTIPVLRPRTMREAVESAHEERSNMLGSDMADVAGSAHAELIQAAHELYEAALDRDPTGEEIAQGLDRSSSVALHEVAKAVAEAKLPREESLDAIDRATGHSAAPDAVEHFYNVATGEKKAEVVAETPAERVEAIREVEAEAQEIVAPEAQREKMAKDYEAIPEITESPLWDAERRMPKEGVTAEELENLHLFGELPERMREVVPEVVEISPEIASVKDELKPLVDDATINAFERRTADEVEQSEPIVASIESKANSDREVELNEAIRESDAFVEGQPAGEGRAPGDARPNEQPGPGVTAVESPLGKPEKRSGPVNYYVEGKNIYDNGWAKSDHFNKDGKRESVGIDSLAQKLSSLFGSRVAIVDGEGMKKLGQSAESESYVQDGTLVINVESKTMRPSALVEEAAHLWLDYMRGHSAETKAIHDRGIELVKSESPFYKYMEGVHLGKDVLPDKLTKEEASLARQYVQKYGKYSDPIYALANEALAKSIRAEGKDLVKMADAPKSNFGKWLNEFWNAVKGAVGFSNLTPKAFAQLKLSEFSKRAAEEIGSGQPLTKSIAAERSKIQKRARRQEAAQGDVEMGDMLDAVGSRGAKSNPQKDGYQIIEVNTNNEPVTADPVINSIGERGGAEVATILRTKSWPKYRAMVKALEPIAGDFEKAESMLIDILSNPEAASAEAKDALGISYTKKRGGDYVMKAGPMADALVTLSAAVGEGHSPAEISRGLAEYHKVIAEREIAHEKAVQKGTENNLAGVEKKMSGKKEGAFVDALIKGLQDGTVKSQGQIDVLARANGITNKEAIDRLLTLATDKMLAGEAKFSLASEYSPRDEREDFLKLLNEAAEADIENFHTPALKLIKSALDNWIIDRDTAKLLHRAVRDAVGDEAKIFEFLKVAERTMLEPVGEGAGNGQPPTGTAPKAEAASEQSVTSIKNAQTDKERKEMGLEPAMEAAAYEFGSEWDVAMKKMERNSEASAEVMDRLRKDPTKVQPEDNALLLHRQVTFRNERRHLIHDINTSDITGTVFDKNALELRLAEVTAELQDIYDIDKAIGSYFSKGLNTRRMMAREDYSLEAMVSRERAVSGNEQLPPEVMAKIEATDKRLKEIEQELADLKAKKEADGVGEARKKAEREIENEKPKAGVGSKLGITAKPRSPRISKEDILAAAKAKIAARRGVKPDGTKMFSLAPEAVPVNPEALELKAEIVAMVKYYLEEGYRDTNEIMSLVHTDMLEIVPELTLRDIGETFTEYGKVKEPTKDDILKELARVKEEERLLISYDRVVQGIAPSKSGPQRHKSSDYARELKREVNRLMVENGIETTDPAKQLATALDAIKSRLRNQIADLNRQKLTGEKTSKRKGVAYDDVAMSLLVERDRLRAELEKIEGKREMTDEQRIKVATAAIERSIKEYERRITEGDLDPAKKVSKTPETPELIALREQRDKLKDDIEALREIANPKKSPEEIALERFKANIRRRMQELNDRMATGNYDKTVRKVVDLDAEGIQLTLDREKVIFEYEKRLEQYRLGKRTMFEKAKEMYVDLINLPKSLESTLDMSAPLRQGAILGAGNPVEFAGAGVEMFKQAFSEKRAELWLHALHNSPIFPLIRQSKLYIAEPTAKLSAKEEQFMSNIAHKIPGYGILVKGSERAYTGFLNKLRADVFEKGVKQLRAAGITERGNPKAYADLATFINDATGRGALGPMMEKAAPILNGMMFSPRMLASRLNLLNPVKYARMDPAVRKIALKNMMAFVSYGITILTLAGLAGAETEADPRSADFGKIKVGDTRYDLFTGFLPIIRTIAQYSTGQRKSTGSGDIIELDGTGYGGDDRTTPIMKFARAKASPAFGAAINLSTGRDMVGNEVTVGTEAASLVTPLYLQDMAEILMDDSEGGGWSGVAKTAIPTFFGVGVQRYPRK